MRTFLITAVSILILFLQVQHGFAQSTPLNGTYTIGSGGNYSTFNAAINSLASRGINGPVLFNIKSGDYNEQISIPEIAGSSTTNTITFQSETGDSTKVKIYFASNYSNNYIVKLNGADHLVFRKLTIEVAGTNYGRGIVLDSSANYNRFESDIVRDQSTTGNCGECGDEFALVYANPNFNNDYNSFSGNIFENSAYAFSYSYSKGLSISNNIFTNQITTSLYILNQDSVIIRGNTINSLSNYYYYYAIYCSDCNNFLSIEKNKIFLPNATTGIYLNNCIGTSSKYRTIANNFVTVSGASDNLYSLYVYASSYLNITYNSLFINSNNSNYSQTLFLDYGSNINLKNNIIDNSAGGYAVYNQNSIDSSDYNNFYTSGNRLAYWSGDQSTLSDLQMATSLDQHSISINPFFNSNGNLHVTDAGLNGKGKPDYFIKDDIDGQIRNPSFPDLGADEFTPPAIDAGIISVEDPKKPFMRGNRNVSVKIKNFGTNPLTSAVINWTVNGASQPGFNWSGNLSSGQSQAVNIGSFDFNGNVNYTIKSWTKLPNGIADVINNNDTIQVVNLIASLSGTYTIGGLNPDFANFQEALTSLNDLGILDNVVFKVRNGTYSEQLSMSNITGASDLATITFESESGDSSQVILSFASNYNWNNYVIQLIGADFVTFNKITIASLNTSYGIVVDIRNSSSHNTFKNCIIKGVNSYSGGEATSAIYSPTYTDEYNVFTHNRILNGSYGIFYYGQSSLPEKGTRIEYNQFENQDASAIRISYQDSLIIQNNTITNNSSNSGSNGIDCSYSINQLNINKNTINMATGGTGINLNSCNRSSSTSGLISNNFISIGGTGTAYGIYLTYSEYENIYNNNINIIASNSGRDIDISSNVSSPGSDNIVNNILANNGGGYCYFVNPPLQINISDYNDYYTTGLNIGYWLGNISNLSQLQSKNGKDSHSISINPQYISNTDLHVKESALNNAGKPLAIITDDIDGDLRNAVKPDIGADEFNLSFHDDAGVFAFSALSMPFTAGSKNVIAIIKNFGAEPLKNVAIDWSINNLPQARYNWSGTLATGDTVRINLGTYSFNLKTNYTVKSWTSLPNGQTDPNSDNDSSQVTNLFAGLNGVFTIGGSAPDFLNFSEAATSLKQGGITGNVVFNVRNGTYNEQISLNKIMGTAKNSSILFESESGDSSAVILSYSADVVNNYTLQLNGTGYLRFNKLTIRATNTDNGNVIDLRNNSDYNTFSNCILKNPSANSIIIGATTNGLSNDYNRFINNKIINGGSGIYFDSNVTKGTIIENNVFENQYIYAISVSFQDSLIVRKNIVNTNSALSYFTALNCTSCNTALRIEKNQFFATNGGRGIVLFTCNGTNSTPALIANNFIQIGGALWAMGINCSGSSYQDVYYNSINITNTNNNSSAFYASDNNDFYRNIDLRNNILSNSGGGYALYSSFNKTLSFSDYNDLYATGTNLAYWVSNKVNLADLKLISKKDSNSIAINPQFFSITDLHVRESSLNSAATPINIVTDDIDGNARDLNFPDIGADEFENTAHDLSVTAVFPTSGCMLGSSESVKVTVKNLGAYIESGFNVVYRIDDDLPVTEKITQTIPAGVSVNYTFNKKANLSGIKSYSLKAYTDLTGDEHPLNDTIVGFISNMPKLKIKLSNDTTICAGSNVRLIATGADSYKWDSKFTGNSLTVGPLKTTSYIVEASNLFNCTDTDTVTIRVNPFPPVPSITASGPTTFCNDSLVKVMLTSSIDHDIIWNTQENTPSIMVNNAGLYSIRYTDTNGCSSVSQTVQVVKENAPVVDPLKTTICSSVPVTLTVNNSKKYLWSTGASTQSIIVSPTVTSTYTVTATTALGCKSVASSIIHVLPVKTPGQVSGMMPANGSTGLNLPLDFSWMPADNASYYDLYLWPASQTKPLKPYASNISSIRLNSVSYTLNYGEIYNWQLISKYYECQSTPGPVQTLTLRYLPDLVINNVQIPNSAFTGQEIEITWDVKNQGLGNTANQTWSDYLSLSIDSTVADNFYPLGTIRNMTYLEPGQSYSKKGSFLLPKNVPGLFNVFALANSGGDLSETIFDNNLARSNKPLLVILSPTPDLFVSEVISPSDFFSEDTINISWKVVNKGKWPTETGTWTDRVYISKDFNTSKKYVIGDFEHSANPLKPEETYSTSHSVVIPEGIFGKYYFYVETDKDNQIQENAYDGNNVSQSDSINVILRPPADLEVSGITIPKSTTNIGTANITWKVKNIGNSSPHDLEWTDAVYLSKSPVFKPDKSYIFPFIRTTSNGIPINFEYFNNENIKIPNNIIPGDYYAFIKTDNNDDVFEYTYNQNNLLRSDTTIKITIAPWPDLVVSKFAHPDSAGAGETIPVSYSVTNKGSAIAKGAWTDRIYLINGNTHLQLKEIKRYDKLDIDSSYIINTSLVLPSGFAYGSGIYQVYVHTDTSNTVYEHTSENNNRLTNTIFIKPSDLTIPTANIPATVYSGTKIKIAWTVKNSGNASTPVGYWSDKTEILDSLQHLIAGNEDNQYIINGPVKPGASYTNTVDFLIPDGISGNYYLRLNTDVFNDNNEKTNSNNVKLIPVKVIFRQPTDLIIKSFTLPASGTAGQPITINWEVKNTGPGGTLAGQWTDKIFLTQDTLANDGEVLWSYTKTGGLTSGASYTVSQQVFLPINSVGNFYAVVKTDYSGSPHGEEYEYKAENNNSAYSLITINLAPPSDLVVTSITAPAKVITGEAATIGWTVKNIGPNKATGYLTDMVYFSKDNVWDIDDQFFGEKQAQIDLNPGQELSSSLTTELTGTSMGDYYVIVRTDNKNNINEVTDLNNTLSSASTINVEVPLLSINIAEKKILKNNKGLYYRIDVPDSLIDETLLISLKGDSINGANELFIRYDKVPDRSDYDFAYRVPFYGNQEVIVSGLKKGTYYLLVYGNVSVGTQQNISLLAQIINFQIRSIKANKGGNKGTLTAEMYGAKFTSTMKVKLQNSSYSVQADTLIFVDATKVYVTFNLMNVPLGNYDVIATNSGSDSTQLKNGFEVVENSPFGLVTSVKAPVRMRINTEGVITVQFANEGNTDLPIPRFKIISEDKLALAFLKKDLSKNQSELEFELREVEGPQHVLRPGAVNSVYIWVQSGRIARLAHFRFE